ncbi:MAG: hypothetical protein EBU81_09995 [Proteobacteria bacterium]|nr:hypothetical protein [Pseudomonadota bacterium]
MLERVFGAQRSLNESTNVLATLAIVISSSAQDTGSPVSAENRSRLLMAKIGIRGTNPKLPDLVKDRAQDLRDAASSLLQTKTLMDIERQGARNTIRAELKNAFARVIGQGSFSEVVIPDMAVQ